MMPSLTPELLAIAVLVAGAVLVLLLVGPFTTSPGGATWLGIATLAVSVLVVFFSAPSPEASPARLVIVGVALAGAVALLLVPSLELEQSSQRPEAVALVLLAAGGGVALAMGTDLLQVVLGLETISLSVAVLVALGKGERPLEAAFRYFVLAAISLAIFLYGVGLIYLSTGSLTFPTADAVASGNSLLIAGMTLVALGILFEISVVPLQWGLLDAYTAAPPAVAGFAMATAKLGAIVVLVRLSASAGDPGPLASVFVAIGVLSIAWGTVGALAQRELRRLLAYSTVVHAGFMALGLGSGPGGWNGAIFYVVVYGATALLVFASLAGRGTGPLDLRSISAERLGPLRAIGLAIGLLSLAGIPPAPGFWAKLAVLGPAWQVAGTWPTAIAVIGGVAGVLYYLRPLPDLLAAARESGLARPLAGSAVVLAGAAVIVLGLAPGIAWSLAGLLRGG